VGDLSSLTKSLDPSAASGLTQGPEGIGQGFEGANVGMAMGPTLGMQRSDLQPTAAPLPGSAAPGTTNPYADIIKRLSSALFTGPPSRPGPGGGTPAPLY
jgi:hypothetical protein